MRTWGRLPRRAVQKAQLRSVFSFYRDRSRSGIKPCNPKNQIWDKSRNKWYLSHSGCGIKSGIHTTFLAHSCGSTTVERLRSRRIDAGSRQTRLGQVALRRASAVHLGCVRAAALPRGANLNAGAATAVAEAEVDNLEAGGFFARFGREPTGPLPTVIPAHTGGSSLGTP